MTKTVKEKLWKIMREHAPESITWNHYDLANNTEIHDSDTWKEFLSEQDVIDWTKEEQAILQRYELAKITADVANSRSVGQAQLINAMEKINQSNENRAKKGPVFIYTYVPLNQEQANAENVRFEDHDIFLAEGAKPGESRDNDVPDFNFD